MATATKKASSNGAQAASVIELRPLNIQQVEIPIYGTAPLIIHAWSDKAKKMMLDKQMNPGTKPKKDPKVPVEEYEAAFHRLPDGRPGFPSGGFKAAIVGACRLFDGLPMTQAKIAIRVTGEGPNRLIPIVGEPYMREDMVRLETGVADIRYRPSFLEWAAILPITFNASLLSLDSLVHLVDAAGQGGIGEMRPSAPKSSSGDYGTFAVEVGQL